MRVPKEGVLTSENAKRERLLHLHGELREEIRMRIRQSSRQLLATTAASASVLGYSAVADSTQVVAVIPILIAFAAIQAVATYNEMMQVAAHIAAIEKRLTNEDSLFRYEIMQGGAFGETRHDNWKWSAADLVPRILPSVVVGVLYIGSSILAISVWSANIEISLPTNRTLIISPVFLQILYVAIAVLLGFLICSHLWIRTQLANERGYSIFYR